MKVYDHLFVVGKVLCKTKRINAKRNYILLYAFACQQFIYLKQFNLWIHLWEGSKCEFLIFVAIARISIAKMPFHRNVQEYTAY